MKKTITLMLIISVILSMLSVFSVSSSAAMPSPDLLNGYENVCLTYTFDYGASTKGRHSVNDLKPYVGYYDAAGNLEDFFFDSYLFLPCMGNGPSGARMHTDSINPTKAIDWTAYVEDTFAEGYNVDALEVAFGDTKEVLGNQDKKAGVFFTILYPNKNATNFGTLGGRELNFSKMEDRKYAVKWIIDEQVKLYNQGGYEHLELVGFYWLEEYLAMYEDIELFQYTSQYLHSLGLKFIWIPWYCANGYNQWKQLGFDVACMQPNLFWMDNPANDRVEISCNTSSSLGMSMEMELDARALTDKEYFNRYLLYLEDGMNNEAMDSVKMYYQDRVLGVYYQACYSTSGYGRDVYDLTYKYATKTLTQDDINKYRDPVVPMEIPEDVEWISQGKSYTASKSFGAGGTAEEYQNISGKELTDGIFGSSDLGTEWHAFHKSLADENGKMSIVIDLGEVRNDITHFMAQFNDYEKYGIGAPEKLQIASSEDGETFKLVGIPKIQDDGNYTYFTVEKGSPITARYIRLTFTNAEYYNFVMCSEFMVGAKISASETTEISNAEQTPPAENSPVMWIVLASVLVVASVVVVIIIVAKKKKSAKE